MNQAQKFFKVYSREPDTHTGIISPFQRESAVEPPELSQKCLESFGTVTWVFWEPWRVSWANTLGESTEPQLYDLLLNVCLNTLGFTKQTNLLLILPFFS